MKKQIISSLVAAVLLFVGGCQSRTNPPETPKAKNDFSREFTKFEVELDAVKRQVKYLESFIENDPRLFLLAMDRDLNDLEKGREPVGNFTDWFAPNAEGALKAGASKKDVMVRVERTVALAEKGLYLSSYEEQLVREGGTKAVREYFAEILAKY